MIEKSIPCGHINENSYANSALGTALHILRCIDNGQSTTEIIQSLDGNDQLVSVWIPYLTAIRWLEQDTEGNLLVSEDGKSWVQGYYAATSSKLQEHQPEPVNATNTDLQNDGEKSQNGMADSFQSAYAKFMETIMCHHRYWNYYWWWILPAINRIAELYVIAVTRFADNSKAASRVANEALSANMKLFSL
jgi:hypothetical protein